MRSGLRVFSFLAVLFVLAGISTTAFAAIHTNAHPKVRVTTKVDDTKRATLVGHVPGAVRHGAQDLGHVDPGTRSERMVLVLKSDENQKRELRRMIDEQHDKNTANFHQWATPEEFGARFGVHDNDIGQVKAWLVSHGFSVDDVSKSKRVIHFSGTTGQIEQAFGTEMHYYLADGQMHVSNNSEISVPKALEPVIAGVSLHNFFRKGSMGPTSRIKHGPHYTSSSSVHYVSPADFQTIYNTKPLLANGIDGTGQTIAVVGRSDILMSDVQTYRQMFGLPPNDPNFIHAGQDNGIEPGDDGESDLDVEISGGTAPNATVDFVIGTPTFLVDGITNSTEYIVENNLADIMSISYGDCEGNEGVGGNEFNLQAFEQAAAQGISVFIASGDNGPAGCDDQNDSYENLGYAAPAEGSTPYSIAVGATEFHGDAGAGYSTFWNTNTAYPFESALSYIPEYPWNEAKASNLTATASSSLSGLWSSSGAVSAYYLRPAWQQGANSAILATQSDPSIAQGGNWLTGVTLTSGGSGYASAPTVSFTGGGCATEPAVLSPSTTISGGVVTGILVSGLNYGTQGGTLAGGQGIGCTSAPTVVFSGGTPTVAATATATVGPMWNVDPLVTGVPHRLTPDIALNGASDHDATFFCSEGVCEFSGNPPSLVAAGLVGGTSVAAPSMAGIQALINQANGGRQGMPGYVYYALAAAESTSSCNANTLPGSSSSCVFQDVQTGNNLICGTSTCTTSSGTKIGFSAQAGFDLTTGLGSVNAYNMAQQWQNVTFNSSNTTLNLSQTTGIAHGGSVTFSGTVSAGSGSQTPTGDVAFILSQGSFGQTVNVNTGAFNTPGAFATLSGGNYSAVLSDLPAGTYTITARYGGDGNFASSISAPVTVTVGSENSVVTLTPYLLNGTSCVITNQTSFTGYTNDILVNANVAGVSGAGAPTGTLTISLDGNPLGTYTLDPNGNAFVLSGPIPSSNCLYDYDFANVSTFAGGSHTLTASYSGDGTFSAGSATPVGITISQSTPTLTLAAGATQITSGFNTPLVATFGGITGINTATAALGAAPTGTVTFMNGATVLGSGPIVSTALFSGNNYTYSAAAELTTAGITASGANSITAVYAGDSNWGGVTSAPVTVTVTTGTAQTVAVTSNGNPTTLNGRPTLTATMSSATSGAVTFYDGTTVLGAGSAVSTAHTSTFRPASGAAFFGGAHSITATYAGASTFMAATSPVFTQNVTQGTNSIQLAAKLLGTATQNYTLTAVLTPSQTNATYAPNRGVVTFLDGGNPIGTAVPQTITSAQGGYALWTATVTVSLAAGTHTMTAQYSDINYSLGTSNTQTVTVDNPASQSITFTQLPPASAAYGSTFTVAATGGGSGNPVVFTYNNLGACITNSASNTGNTATYKMTSGTGVCSVIASQAGTGSTYSPDPVIYYVNATQVSQSISCSVNAPSSAAYGTSFTLVCSGGASGNALVYTSSGSCSNVGATYTMTSASGICNEYVNQAGNNNYTAAPQNALLTSATQAATTINVTNVNPSSESYGQDSAVTITAQLSWSGSGAAPTAADVSISGNGNGTYGATSCGAPVSDTVTCTAAYTPTLADGPNSYTETATFSGDSNYSASSSPQSNNFSIGQETTTTSVIPGQNPVPFGQSVTFTATVNTQNGDVKGRHLRVKSHQATGTVTWSGNTGCSVSTLSGDPGTATCTTSSLPQGTDTVTATYAGDSAHGGSMGSVNEIVSTTTIDVTNVSPAAEDYAADAQVTITAVLSWTGNGPAPTASDITIGGNGPSGTYGTTSCGAPVGTTITCTNTYTPTTADVAGTYTETASFSGDGNYGAASSPETNNFAINQATTVTAVGSTPNPSTYATSVTFTATITAENSFVKGRQRRKPHDVTGSVAWSSNTGCGTTSVTGGTNGNPGTATCTTSSATHLPVGTDTVTATYSGDSNHGGSVGSVAQVVNGGIATTIDVTSVSPSAEDFAADAPVTITAVLSWTGHGTAPTSSDVTISGNGNGTYGATSCSPRVHETITCTATYTPSNGDTPGSYTETAAFSGDTNYSPSSSPETNNFTINMATSSTGVICAPSPSTYGQSVTCTATINGENGFVRRNLRVRSQDITGSVAWSANTGCGTTSVTSGNPGTATCTTTALGAGSNTVTGTYSGDSNHGGSMGSASQTVNQASQTITVTSIPTTAAKSTSFTVQATGGGSGNALAYTSAGNCTNGGSATYTMGTHTTACSVIINQAGNSNYLAATQVSDSVAEAAAVTCSGCSVSAASPTAVYQTTDTVSAVSGSDISVPTFTVPATSTVCSISGNTVTMLKGTGTCTVTATWAANYAFLKTTKTTVITAEKATSFVTWATPAPITYGTKLSATQLDASAADANNNPLTGTFTYTPGLNKVLTAGTQVLSVKFTPNGADGSDYTTVPATTVNLTVNMANTTTTITPPTGTPTQGHATTIYFPVSNGSTTKPTGTVTLTASNGQSCSPVTLAAGTGHCSITWNSSGSITLTATYSGDANDNASAGMYVVTVAP